MTRSLVAVLIVGFSLGLAGCGSSSPSRGVVLQTTCGVHVAGARLLDRNGRLVYREPGHYVNPNGGPGAQVKCSGATVWAVWLDGAGMMHENYVGVVSGDGGRTWRFVFSDPFFGMKAPHALDPYFGPWALHGPDDAYFVGSCPACGAGKLSGTVGLFVTIDGGKTFFGLSVPALDGYTPTSIRVSGRNVTIRGKGFIHNRWRRKTATVFVASPTE